MADLRSFILVILIAPLAHAQVGPSPEWLADPTPTTSTLTEAGLPESQPGAIDHRGAASAGTAALGVGLEEVASVGSVAAEALPLGTPAAQRKNTSSADDSRPGIVSSAVLPLALVLGLIVALAAGARAIMRSKGGLIGSLGAGGRAPSGVLEVLGRYPVARGSTLVLLKLDRRVLLVAQTRAGKIGGTAFTTLSEITDPEDVASVLLKTRDDTNESMSKRFTSLLGAFERRQQVVEHAAPVRHNQRVHRTSGGSLTAHPVTTHEPAGGVGVVGVGAIASVRQRLADMRSSEVAR